MEDKNRFLPAGIRGVEHYSLPQSEFDLLVDNTFKAAVDKIAKEAQKADVDKERLRKKKEREEKEMLEQNPANSLQHVIDRRVEAAITRSQEPFRISIFERSKKMKEPHMEETVGLDPQEDPDRANGSFL